MAKVITDEQHYYDIADAIRGKLGVETLYLPSEMAAAIETIEAGTELTSEDEGKVVVEDAGSYVLTEQTSLSVSQNGTYDTTTNDEVVVSVSSGGGGAIYDQVPEGHYVVNFNPTSNASNAKSGGYEFTPNKPIMVSKVRVFPRTTSVNVYVTKESTTVASVLGATVVAEQWNDVTLEEPITLEADVSHKVWYSHVDGTALKYVQSNISSSIEYINVIGTRYSFNKDTIPSTSESSTIYGVDLYVDAYLTVREAVLISKAITSNGTYNPSSDNADGYSLVTVNVSGGSKNILSGDEVPTASVGTDGDIYLLLSGDLVPIGATSNLIAGQSLNSGSYPAKNAFDGDDSTFWTTADRNYNDMYIGYDTGDGSQATCIAVSICPRQWANNVQIGDFKVQGSNDLTTWVDVASLTMPNDAATYAGVWTRFDFQNSTPYRAWRVLALTLNGSVTFTIYGLQFHTSSDTISETYLKVNGSWVPIEGQDIDDVNTGD